MRLTDGFEHSALIHETIEALSKDPYQLVSIPAEDVDRELPLIHWCANYIFKIKVDTLPVGGRIEVAFNGYTPGHPKY